MKNNFFLWNGVCFQVSSRSKFKEANFPFFYSSFFFLGENKSNPGNPLNYLKTKKTHNDDDDGEDCKLLLDHFARIEMVINQCEVFFHCFGIPSQLILCAPFETLSIAYQKKIIDWNRFPGNVIGWSGGALVVLDASRSGSCRFESWLNLLLCFWSDVLILFLLVFLLFLDRKIIVLLLLCF